MENKLNGKRVAILATNGFEESELKSPKEALEKAGATVHVVSPEKGAIKGWKDGDWSDKVDVDRNLSEAKAADYDALLLPGGVINPDTLRQYEKAVASCATSSPPRNRWGPSATDRGPS